MQVGLPDNSNLPPRWQQALTTWKAYAGIAAFVIAVGTTIADYSNKLPSLFRWWRDLPLPAKIVLGILAVIVGTALIISALSRRSVLVRREKFDLQPGNPEQLIARDEDIRRISNDCIRSALVFLLGESGAGKSALVEAGLMPNLEKENANNAGRLVPVRIDASALDWKRGLRLEVARCVRAMRTELLKSLGVTDFQNLPNADEVFPWLELLPEVAPRRLLIILDQIDDYFVAHQTRFITAEGCIAQPNDLFVTSDDWKGLANLTQKQRISLLLVCRTDSAAPLSALRFQEPRQPVLRRITEQDARQLLARITEPENNKPVIVDPEFGWEKLRERLLVDISDKEGQILPSDLAAGLRNLRNLRYLDIAAYTAAGGLDGLENNRIQTIVREASAKAKLSSDALFRALLTLTSDDGRKTMVRSVDEFATITLRGQRGSDAIDTSAQRLALIEPALNYLKEERILRPLLPESGHESLALFHDRLARSIRRAEMNANKWVHLLRDGNRKWQLAGNWRERWRSFLSIGVQIRLLWERFRGQMHYAENARFAAHSLLRGLPYLFLCAILTYGFWSWKGSLDYRSAEAIAREISPQEDVTIKEAKALEQLASTNLSVRLNCAKVLLSTDVEAQKVKKKPALIAHAIVGLDPDSKATDAMIRRVIGPIIRNPDSSRSTMDAALTLAAKLPASGQDSAILASLIVERMKSEKESSPLELLGQALGALSTKLQPKDVEPGGAILIEQMKSEKRSWYLASLGRALVSLSNKLDPATVNAVRKILVEQLKSENNSAYLEALCRALVTLNNTLEPKNGDALNAGLFERLKSETNSESIVALGQALASSSNTLEPKDLEAGGAILVERMQSETTSNSIAALGQALASLSTKLQPTDVEAGGAILVERMQSEKDSSRIAELGQALASLGPKLQPKNVELGSAVLLNHIKSEKDSDSIAELGAALGSFNNKLDTKDAEAVGAIFVQRLKSEAGLISLDNLGKALVSLSNTLEPNDVETAYGVFVERLNADTDRLYTDEVHKTFVSFNEKTEPKNPAARGAALVKLMKSETDPDFLAGLGQALGRLSSKVGSKEVSAWGAMLAERIKSEEDPQSIAGLSQALASLSNKLDPKGVEAWNAVLIERIKSESNTVVLGRSLAAWTEMEPVAYHNSPLRQRIQICIDLLQHPLVVGDAQKAILTCAKVITGHDFHNDLREFTDWASSVEGKKLGLSVKPRPYVWSMLNGRSIAGTFIH